MPRMPVAGVPAVRPGATMPPHPVVGPRIAIILDDWGNNRSLLKAAVDIHEPITLSVLPNLIHSREIADEAFQNHLGVMLHMPMEPKSKKERLEPHTIMTTTPDAEIASTLDAALQSVPHAEGVNNHMGSAATCDARVMKVFLSRLKEKGLFFVDSNTIKETVGPKIAKELGIPFAKRDIFIDNDPKKNSVEKQLLKAEVIALKMGFVVVIGHDKKATLEALKEMAPAIEKAGVRFVLVKELLE